MALRIIRKSASQSYVEVIRGTALDRQAQLSILCYIQTLEELEALKNLIQTDTWIHDNAEFIVMKGSELQEALRPHFQPQAHSIKLVNAPEKISLSRSLRTLVQEATTHYCWFLPWVPDTTQIHWLPEALTFLQSNPNHAAIGPLLSQNEQILAAGQCLALNIPAHRLSWQDKYYDMPAAKCISWCLGRTVDTMHWRQLATAYEPVPALPLSLLLFSRSAYLSLSWEDTPWDQDWLAQDMCIGFHQQQYWVHLVPFEVQVPARIPDSALFTGSPMPELFEQRWRPVFREMLPEVYAQLGFVEQKNGQEYVFLANTRSSQDPVAAYFAELKVS